MSDDLSPGQRERLTSPNTDAVLVAPGDTGNHAPVPRAAITPRARDQYLVKFTASRATYEKLKEAQALLRHQVPSGDVAEIFECAMTLLLAELRRTRHAATPQPRATSRAANTSRHVPAAVKREVWAVARIIGSRQNDGPDPAKTISFGRSVPSTEGAGSTSHA